jgi:hypothetical protein
MAAIDEGRSIRSANGYDQLTIVQKIVSPETVNLALEPLRMASKLDRYRPSARMMLEPWLVERALSRFGDKRLSVEEQEKVVRAVRTPHKVRWPDWWKVTTP